VLRYSRSIIQMQTDPSGRLLYILEGGRVHTLDLATRQETRPTFGQRQRAMAMSADGRRLLTGGSDKAATLWDLATIRPLTPPMEHQDEIRGVAFTPDGHTLLTATENGQLRFWDSTGKALSPSFRPANYGGRIGTD